jgi:hypothetical protein
MIKKHKELTEYVNANINRDLEIGINDCNIIVLEVIDMLTSSNYSSLKGQYKSYRKGLRLAQEQFGYTYISDLLDEIATPIEVQRIHIGDIIVRNLDSYSCCLVSLGDGFYTQDTLTKQTKIVYLSAEELKEHKAYRLK